MIKYTYSISHIIEYSHSIKIYTAYSQNVINDFKRQTNDPYTKIAVAGYTKATYHQNTSILYDLNRSNPTNKLDDELFNLVEQNRTTLFRDLIDDYKIKDFAGIDRSNLEKEDSLKGLITAIHEEIYSSENNDSLKNLLFKVKESFNEHVESYNQSYSSYYQLKYGNNSISNNDIRTNLLSEETSLIEYFEDDTAYYAFHITKETTDIHYLSNKETLNPIIQSWRNSISEIDLEATQFNGSKLYNLLWKPIIKSIKEKVIIIPSGSLFYLSFEALPDVSSKNKYLIESHTIVYALSSSVLEHQNKQIITTSNNSYIIAPGFESDIKEQYQSELPSDEPIDQHYLKTIRQPWSINLAKYISKEKKIQPLLGQDATETYLKSNLKEANIFHFATHAIAVEDDPLRSKLVLSKDIGEQQNDGYLHAYELYNFPLKAELAILSACESGIGSIQDGEGMISLAYSINYAGCPSVALSLWKIDEKSNAAILKGFYQNLNKSRNKSEALRQAKLNYLQLNDGILIHPFYWSGMIIMGNDQPMSLERKWWPKYKSWILLGLFLFIITIYLKRTAK